MANTEEQIIALEEKRRQKSRELEELARRKETASNKKKIAKLEKEIEQITVEMAKIELLEQVNENIDQAKLFIDIAKQIIESNKAEAFGVISHLLSLIGDLQENLEPTLNRLSELNSKRAFRDYNNLKTAGFSPNEAFSIILAKTRPTNIISMINEVASTATSATAVKKR